MKNLLAAFLGVLLWIAPLEGVSQTPADAGPSGLPAPPEQAPGPGAVLAAPVAPDSGEATQGPQRVVVGAYINDIQTVDLATHSYAVDLYVWFRWSSPDLDPSNTMEFMNKYDPEGHVRTLGYVREGSEDVSDPQPQPGGLHYQFIRQQGLFSSKFPLGAYPFDRQSLVITFEDSVLGAEDLVYEPDADGVVLNPEIKLPGYRIGKPELAIRDKFYPTAFGDLASPDTAAYSHVEIRIPVARPWWSGLFKVLAPVFLIILPAAFALLLDPEHVEARVGLAITALLTLVALQFTLLSGLPEVSYLTLLDQVFLASYAYILMVIGLVVRGTRVDRRGRLQRADGGVTGSGAVGSLVLTLGYAASVGLIIWLNIATAA